MKSVRRLASASALAVAAVTAFATPALAQTADRPHDRNQSEHHYDDNGRFARGADHVVFVQTDNPSGNAVVAYDRADDGTLTQAGTYPTGGNGGVLTGSVVDHLASQASLTYDDQHALLFAVNAGSNTVSVFSVNGDHLTLRQVVPSVRRVPGKRRGARRPRVRVERESGRFRAGLRRSSAGTCSRSARAGRSASTPPRLRSS